MQSKIISIVILAVLVGGGAYYYFYYLPANRVETIKISSANAENMKFLLAVTQDKGFADNNRIKLEVVFSDPGEAERKLISRAEGIEVGTINPIAMSSTNQAQNIKLRAFASVYNTDQTIMVKAASPFYKVEDLIGAKLAIHPKGSASYTAYAVGMKVAGLDLERDFKLIFGSFAQNAQRLADGEVDGSFLNAVATARLLATGNYREIVNLDEKWSKVVGSPMPFVDLAAHEDWVLQNPKKVQRLRKAILEAVAFIRQNPGLIGEYKGLLGIQSASEVKLAEERLPAIYPAQWNTAIHDALLRRAFELGLLKELPPEKLFID